MHSKAFRRRLQVRAAAAPGKAAVERAEARRVHIEWALSRPGLNGKPISFRGAGEKLNELQIPSPMGGRWTSMNVADIAVRLKLCEKPIRVPRNVVQQRVAAIWKAHPDCTGQQVVEMLKPQHPMCIARAWAFFVMCRLPPNSLFRTTLSGSWAQNDQGHISATRTPRECVRAEPGGPWAKR
jgi:hypothetical protein